jgi:predicted P-loop ATPase
MKIQTIEKEVLEILRNEYFPSMSYDTYCKSFTHNGQPVNINRFNFDFMDKHDIHISDESMRNLLHNGCENVYSSMRLYIERAYNEYGTNNSIDTLTKDILTCQTRIEELYVKKFLVSAVARVFKPGCQVDQVLVLQSRKQGIYKTSFFRTLAGSTNFSTIRPQMNETELMKLCSSFWMLCYDELESNINKRNIAKVKSFITTTHDAWRRYYTTSEFEKVPRTFVLCGTTNKERFLVDDSGERRFWVTKVHKPIDIPWVEKNRERIWGEAFHLFKENYQWWLTPDEQEESNALNQNFKQTNGLTESIKEYVECKKENNEPFRLKDLCAELNLPPTRNDIIDILVDICGLIKPTKTTRYKKIKGYWWNYNDQVESSSEPK